MGDIVTRLRHHRSEDCDKAADLIERLQGDKDVLLRLRGELETRIAELEAALAPFALEADDWTDFKRDELLLVGDFRRARALLSGDKP